MLEKYPVSYTPFKTLFLMHELSKCIHLLENNTIRQPCYFLPLRNIFMILELAPRGDALAYVQKCRALSEEDAKSWAQ